MPDKKRSYKRRKSYYRTSLRKKVSKLETAVYKQSEVKHHTITSGAASVSVSDQGNVGAQNIALTTISQGDTDTTRDGDKIQVLSIQVKGNVIGADATNTIRLLLVRNMNGGSSSTLQDFLEANDTTGYQYISAYSHDRVGKYQILWDKTFDTCATGRDVYSFNKYVKIPSKAGRVTYSAGGTSPLLNSYFLCAISDSGAVTHPTMNYYARVRFTDH